MSELLADRLRHFCWLQPQLPVSTVGGRWGSPGEHRPIGWQLRSDWYWSVFGGDRKRRLALRRASQVESPPLNYHDKLQPSWFPLFYVLGRLEILIDSSRSWGVTHGREEGSGSGAPPDLARLLDSACSKEERPWEIILTTWMHLHQNWLASWQLAEVIPQRWHHQWTFFIRILVPSCSFPLQAQTRLCPPSALSDLHHKSPYLFKSQLLWTFGSRLRRTSDEEVPTLEGQGLTRGEVITESIPQSRHNRASLVYQ